MSPLLLRQRYGFLLLTALLNYACASRYDYVRDNAGVLSSDQEEKIVREITELENKIGSQIAVLILDTLNGERLEEFSLRTANEMQLGRKDYNDGILITVVLKEKKMRIEVGTGLENIIDEGTAKEIINEQMKPRFRKKKYFDGLLDSIIKIKTLIMDKKDLIGKEQT